MNKLSNQQILLVALLAVWVLLWFQLMGPSSEPSRVALKNVSGPAQMGFMKEGHVLTGLQQKVRPEGRRRKSPFQSPINIFDLGRSEADMSEFPGDQGMEEVNEAYDQADSFENIQTTDVSRFRFLGYVQLDASAQESQGLALIATPDTLHTVGPGETIDGQILIKGISSEEITIEDLSSHQEQQLLLRARGD